MQKFTKDLDGDIPDVVFYIMKYNHEKQERLLKIRSIMFEKFPNATERIYFGIPTVDMDGKIILQYAAYKKHISLIIGSDFSTLLQEKYSQYNYTDYTVLFPDNEPFPEDFIKEVCGMLDKVNRKIKPFKEKMN